MNLHILILIIGGATLCVFGIVMGMAISDYYVGRIVRVLANHTFALRLREGNSEYSPTNISQDTQKTT